MAGPRRIEKFTSGDGLDVVTFDGMVVSHHSRQGLRGGARSAAGAHFAMRSLGYGPGLLAVAQEDLVVDPFGTAAEVDESADDVLATCHGIGLGKLWTIDDLDVRRWSWACLGVMPEWEMGPFTLFNLPLRIMFDRYTYWLGETPIQGSQSIAASTVNFDITNDGDGRAAAVVFRLESGGVDGFLNVPTLANARGEQSVAVDFDGVTADHEIRMRTDDNAVETSTDAGATYADAYDLATLADDQAGLIELYPGVNPMTYTQTGGTPSASVSWEYYETFYR